MAGKTILISIWNRGKLESPIWDVYKHISITENKCLFSSYGGKRTAEDFALEMAQIYNVPLFAGGELDRNDLLRKLSNNA